MTALQTAGFLGKLNPQISDSVIALSDTIVSSDTSLVSVSDTSNVMPFEFDIPFHSVNTISYADTLEVTAQQMFGPHAVMAPVEGTVDALSSGAAILTGNMLFNIVALICFALYCFSIYFYSQQVWVVTSVFRSKLYVDNLLGDYNYSVDNFLKIALTFGSLTLSLALVKFVELISDPYTLSELPEWIATPLPIWIWGICGVVILYQKLVLNVAGWLTDSRKFIVQLNYLRKINFALFAVICTPVLLMLSLSGIHGRVFLLVLLSAGLGIIVIFHLVRTYMFFVDEKISKLYWFLYLCGVEIFPLTFLAFSLVKS